MLPSPRLSFAEVKRRIKADHHRLQSILSEHYHPAKKHYMHRGFHAVVLFRLANYFRARGNTLIGRLIWHFNTVWTGADISEHADVQEGLVILSPSGVALMATAGKNLTLCACSGLGGELGRNEDIGAGPGLCMIGNNVTIHPHSGVLGPVKVGDNCVIEPVVVVTQNVPDNCRVSGQKVRIFKNAN